MSDGSRRLHENFNELLLESFDPHNQPMRTYVGKLLIKLENILRIFKPDEPFTVFSNDHRNPTEEQHISCLGETRGFAKNDATFYGPIENQMNLQEHKVLQHLFIYILTSV